MLDKRFWDKVEKTSSCWFWTSAKRDGYGMYYMDGSNKSAHRLTYAELKGRIPPNREVDHICMNRNCVNPEHLELVDHITNIERGFNYRKSTSSKKSFLLYIHNPKFRGEPRKSELINRLLEEHYSRDVPPVAKKAPDVTKTLSLKGTCEHGAGTRFCVVKGCKNYQFKRG